MDKMMKIQIAKSFPLRPRIYQQKRISPNKYDNKGRNNNPKIPNNKKMDELPY